MEKLEIKVNRLNAAIAAAGTVEELKEILNQELRIINAEQQHKTEYLEKIRLEQMTVDEKLEYRKEIRLKELEEKRLIEFRKNRN